VGDQGPPAAFRYRPIAQTLQARNRTEALEQVVNEDNADRVQASVICEGANGPVTPAADAVLEDKGVLVLPDVLANAGGVVVSYFEWVQGLQEYFWKEDEVNAKLSDIVLRAFEETWSTRERYATSMRTAAYGLAVQRVAEDAKRALYVVNAEVGRLALTPGRPVGGNPFGYPRGFREGWG